MFSSMVASACTLDVLSSGTNGTRNGALQVVCFYVVFDVWYLWLNQTNLGMFFRC